MLTIYKTLLESADIGCRVQGFKPPITDPLTQRVTVCRNLHGLSDGSSRSHSQRLLTLVFCVSATAFAHLAQDAKVLAFLHRGLERYLYRFSDACRPDQTCGVVIPRRILSRHRAERAARIMFMGDLNERLVIVASQ
ncbi:hypothetical protein [Burkholderia ubonensis]|uniref:hypothetical protein n=1 Tax=Burkholderia ubonensis TaxID=101571 RepID=UPI0012BA9153|nr:hypothetical protein [Burkholderia ubonensis]